MSWNDYPLACLVASFSSKVTDVRAWVKKVKALTVGGPAPADLLLKFLWGLAPPRERIAVLFPSVAYNLGATSLREISRQILRADPITEKRAATLAYLAFWRRFGDPNFFAFAKRVGLGLDTFVEKQCFA